MFLLKSTLGVSKKEFLVRFFIWAIAEILLSCQGLDDIADYSEFLFERKLPVISQMSTIK